MSRRLLLVALGPAIIFVVWSLGSDRPAREDRRPPNVIVVVIDDLGWADLGVYGNRVHETPHLDRLAHEGARFTNAYSNAPNCAPARASILSGQYPPRHGLLNVKTYVSSPEHLRKLDPPPPNFSLPLPIITIAEALKQQGYATASIGKWHLGFEPQFAPVNQGFDVHFGTGSGAGHTRSHFSPYRMPDIPDGPAGEYLGDRLTTEALRFIESNRERPFFLYLSHYAVHQPLQARPDVIAKYRRKLGAQNEEAATYAAMIDMVDQGIGRLLRALEEHGIAANTAIIVMSDNGGGGDSGSPGSLRGMKGTLYEGGLRVPMLVRWPEAIEPGHVYDDVVIGTDVYPTLLDMTGVPRPNDHVLDGESLLPLLAGDAALPARPIFWHFPDYLWSQRLRQFRLTPASAVRAGDYKLIEFLEDGRTELYDLNRDAAERENLSAAKPEKVRELRGVLREWRTSLEAAMPQPRSALN